jgi:hypothetical protein
LHTPLEAGATRLPRNQLTAGIGGRESESRIGPPWSVERGQGETAPVLTPRLFAERDAMLRMPLGVMIGIREDLGERLMARRGIHHQRASRPTST